MAMRSVCLGLILLAVTQTSNHKDAVLTFLRQQMSHSGSSISGIQHEWSHPACIDLRRFLLMALITYVHLWPRNAARLASRISLFLTEGIGLILVSFPRDRLEPFECGRWTQVLRTQTFLSQVTSCRSTPVLQQASIVSWLQIIVMVTSRVLICVPYPPEPSALNCCYYIAQDFVVYAQLIGGELVPCGGYHTPVHQEPFYNDVVCNAMAQLIIIGLEGTDRTLMLPEVP